MLAFCLPYHCNIFVSCLTKLDDYDICNIVAEDALSPSTLNSDIDGQRCLSPTLLSPDGLNSDFGNNNGPINVVSEDGNGAAVGSYGEWMSQSSGVSLPSSNAKVRTLFCFG